MPGLSVTQVAGILLVAGAAIFWSIIGAATRDDRSDWIPAVQGLLSGPGEEVLRIDCCQAPLVAGGQPHLLDRDHRHGDEPHSAPFSASGQQVGGRRDDRQYETADDGQTGDCPEYPFGIGRLVSAIVELEAGIAVAAGRAVEFGAGPTFGSVRPVTTLRVPMRAARSEGTTKPKATNRGFYGDRRDCHAGARPQREIRSLERRIPTRNRPNGSCAAIGRVRAYIAS